MAIGSLPGIFEVAFVFAVTLLLLLCAKGAAQSHFCRARVPNLRGNNPEGH